MTMTQDAPSEYPLLEACILINNFLNDKPENENKTELNKTRKKEKEEQRQEVYKSEENVN